MTIQDLFIYSIYVYDLGLAIVLKKKTLTYHRLQYSFLFRFFTLIFFLKQTKFLCSFTYMMYKFDFFQGLFFSSFLLSLPYLYLLSGTLIIYTKEREKEKRIEFVFFF